MSRFSAMQIGARSIPFWRGFVLACLVLASVPSARADITPIGDVEPADPSTWTFTYGGIGNTAAGTLTVDGGSHLFSSGGYIGYGSTATGEVNVAGSGSTWVNINNSYLYVGYNGSGTLSITSGGSVSNAWGCIGYNSGSTGVVKVDGTGSTWTNSNDLDVGGFYFGDYGNGTLNITNGGSVSVGGATYVGANHGSTGSINFGLNGGTLTTQSLYASPTQLTGTGTINACGLVSDIDLIFDSTHGLKQTIPLQQSGQNVTVDLDMTGATSANGDLGVGWKGVGSLTIQGGITVNSANGYVGYGSASTGVVKVDGTGSTWTNSGELYVGYGGSGTLSITNGGSVSNSSVSYFAGVGYIGYFGATGVVTVDGSNSTWTNKYLYVGYYGVGTLNVTNGGSVSVAAATYVGFDTASTGRISFGANGGTLTTQSLYASPTQLTGTGTINACGLVSDIDLIFDSTHGLKQTIPLQQSGQNVTVNLDMTGGTSANGNLGAGWEGVGSLTIQGGITVNSFDGYLGYGSASTGVATVTGTGSTWTNSDYLYVGYNGSGTLSVTGGGTVSSSRGCDIGHNFGSTGAVTVGGVGSTWTNLFLAVGNDGTGSLTIADGGKVSNPEDGILGYNSGSSGTVTVSGSGSTWTINGDLTVGYSGAGSLIVQNGGNVISKTDEGDLGYFSGSNGSVTVTGSGSTWTNRSILNVGSRGTGSLTIADGGLVSSGTSYIGTHSGSSGAVAVTGSGSTWTISGDLYVGCYGSGSLSISNGGTVSDGYAYIGDDSGSSGTVTVSGSGSKWTNSSSVYVGYYGSGTVTQVDGTVLVSGTLFLGNYSSSNGTYNLNGGALAVHGLAGGSGTAAFNFGGGTLRADADFASSLPMTLTGNGGNATVNTNGHLVSLSGSLTGIGGLAKTGSGTLTLSAANNYSGATTVAGGTLWLVGTSITSPGAWNPVLYLGGADLQAGKLVFDYSAGTDPVSTIKAMLTASCDGGRWDVGQFRDSTAATTGLTLGMVDNTTTHQVTVMATYPGDFNLDGDVDKDDLAIFYAHAFTGTSWQQGDANYDGVVNGLDRDLLVSHIGLPPLPAPSPAGSAVPVPEPGTIALLAAALFSLIVSAWRRRA